jgi:hypothetical protein
MKPHPKTKLKRVKRLLADMKPKEEIPETGSTNYWKEVFGGLYNDIGESEVIHG